jgi:S1-C subfamily serine protease
VLKVAKLILAALIVLSFESCAHDQRTYKHILPRKSFVKIEKDLVIQSCVGKSCIEKSFSAAASGVVIQNTLKGAFVLTAAHVCDESDTISGYTDDPNAKIEINFDVITLDNNRKPVEIINFDSIHDVCVVWVENLFVRSVIMSPTAPEPGDMVLNIAAPLGYFSENMVPIFYGFYSGIDDYNRAAYSLPAYGGSSGSPILNERGELIGMVHSTMRHFNHIALSPNYNALREFVNKTIDQHLSYRYFRIIWRPFMDL